MREDPNKQTGEDRYIPFRPQPERSGVTCPRCGGANTYADMKVSKIEITRGVTRDVHERVTDCFDCWHVWR